MRDMARRVQSLLGFKEQYVDSTVAAQVIGTSGSEQSRVLYIDKGSKDGIKTDMAVITPNGIVGKIVQVFPDVVAGAAHQRSVQRRGRRAEGHAPAGHPARARQTERPPLQYIMGDEKVEPGEEVLTSGGDRIFPKGLPVGKVASVEPGKDLFLNIRVVPVGPTRSGGRGAGRNQDHGEDAGREGPGVRFAPPTFLPNGCRPFPPSRGLMLPETRKPRRATAGPAAAAEARLRPALILLRPERGANKPAATSTATGPKPSGAASFPRPTTGDNRRQLRSCETRELRHGASRWTARDDGHESAQAKGYNANSDGESDARCRIGATNAQAPANGDASTPPPKKAKPAPEQTPARIPTSPSTPPATEPPQP